MKRNFISAVRARRTRDRERQNAANTPPRLSIQDSPAIGLILALLLWLASVALIDSRGLILRWTDLQSILPLVGNAVFLLASIIAAGIFVETFSPGLLRRNASILLLSLIALLSLIIAKGLIFAARETGILAPSTLPFLLPFAMAPLLATILVNNAAGMAVGVWTSIVMTIMGDEPFPIFATGLIASVVAVNTAHQVRTRIRLFKTGLIIGLSEIIGVLGLTAINWTSPDSSFMAVMKQAQACLASGFLCAALALVVLPLFEVSFGITTDITLLELSDLGHPVLQRLAMEAPGTYHHSLVVASLAQAAADEIGANSLQARVAAYFHDIGKLVKPDCFVENHQFYHTNPHEDLTPNMSTLIITAHVKEGVSLAMLHKLPPVILQAIQEHHGTSLVSYFHHKAREQRDTRAARNETDAGSDVGESGFRYPGPKPASRESAILCIADAVEAASRTLEKKSSASVEDLVNDIIASRLEDGQFDDSDLTLLELTRIRRSFVFTLSSMFHGRIPYPSDEDRNQQPSRTAAGEPA